MSIDVISAAVPGLRGPAGKDGSNGSNGTMAAATNSQLDAGGDNTVSVTPAGLAHLGLDGSIATTLAKDGIAGRRTPLVAGTNPINGSTFTLARPATKNRHLNQVEFWNNDATAKTVYFLRELLTGTAFSRVAGTADVAVNLPAVAGYIALPIDMQWLQGEYLTLYGPAGFTTYLNGPSDDGGFYAASQNVSSYPQGALNTSSTLQWTFSYTEGSTPKVVDIDLASIDRVALVSDSYGCGIAGMPGKNFLAELSAKSDWSFENYSMSGQTLTLRLADIRGDVNRYGIGFSRYGATRLIFQSQTNEAGYTPAQYADYACQCIETARGLGALPIIASEHPDTWGAYDTTICKQIADQYTIDFVNVQPLAKLLGRRTSTSDTSGYGGNWLGVHPGVRTNKFFVQAYERYFESIGRPKTSLKIFRPRAGVAYSSVNDLFYANNYDRARLWREFTMGENSFTAGNEKYYDELGTAPTGITSYKNSEYLTLQLGIAAAFTDFALIEFVLPTTTKHLYSVKLTINDVGATIYVPNVLGGTLASGAPVGAWTAVTGVAGVFTIPLTVLQAALRFDKLAIVVAKSGAFSLNAPKLTIKYDGIDKPTTAVRDVSKRARGAEMLAATTFPTSGAPTGWTVTGTVTGAAPADGVVTYGANGIVTVDSSNYVSQPFTYAADNYQDREIEIRVMARRYVPQFSSSTGTYPDNAPVTSDTFDWAKVNCGITSPAGMATQWREVGIGWMELVYRCVAPSGSTSLTLTLSASQAVQIDAASVKFMEA